MCSNCWIAAIWKSPPWRGRGKGGERNFIHCWVIMRSLSLLQAQNVQCVLEWSSVVILLYCMLECIILNVQYLLNSQLCLFHTMFTIIQCVPEGVDCLMMHEIVLGGHLYLQLVKVRSVQMNLIWKCRLRFFLYIQVEVVPLAFYKTKTLGVNSSDGKHLVLPSSAIGR